MDKTRKIEDFMATVNEYIEASKDVAPLKYIDISDKKYMECAGAYSSAMTNAIVSDIRKLAIFIGTDDIETSKTLMLLSASVSNKDIQIRRMIDDRNDNRPISEYKFEGTDNIISILADIKDMDIMQKEPYKDFLNKFKTWVEKISKIDIWAYYITNYAFINEIEDELKMELFKDEDISFIKTLVTLEKILLGAVIKLPLMDSMSSDCLDKIELINGIIKIVRDGDTEKLDRLYRYIDAVNDFSE